MKYLTQYTSPCGGVYYQHVFADSEVEAESLVGQRHLGETLAGPFPGSWTNNDRPSELFKRAIQEQALKITAAHALLYLVLLASRSGVCPAEQSLWDSEWAHQAIHYLDRPEPDPSWAQVLEQIRSIENQIPGFCPNQKEPSHA